MRYTAHCVGDQIGHFVFEKIEYIEELRCTLIELTHQICGASVMHIAADDQENLFCLSFRTLPDSSNGAPHILEHTVLCGSKKYPVKDPFFAMSRRSLNTFMNAMTGSDFTCYPAASQVKQDFYNLLEVYLDAVFYPRLDIKSFRQEGHRLAIKDPKNLLNSPLEFQGIVYNEMKGSLSSADSRLWNFMMQHLVPDLPYSYNFGGDPQAIPDLTHEQLIAFHRKYYHPSQCLFFFYGDIPLEEHLTFLEDHAFQGVTKNPLISALPLQKRFSAPQKIEGKYPCDDKDLKNKTYIAFSFLMMPISEQEDLLSLTLLDSILMDTDASPLRHAMLQSGFCRQCHAYLDVEMSEIPYAIVCRGCEKTDADQLEKLFFQTIRQIIDEGIDPAFIESSLHQLELSRTEINGDYGPFGLNLFMRSALVKQHGCAPEDALRIHSLFDKLLEKIQDPKHLPSILQKYIIENPHYIRILFSPDQSLGPEEYQQEQARLEKIRGHLSFEDLKRIQRENEQLRTYQEKSEEDAITCLPKITLDDVPKHAINFTLTQETGENLTIYHHDVFTNKFLYADLIFDLPALEQRDLPYLQLFSSILCEVGVKDRDYRQQLQWMHAHTGGIGAGMALHQQLQDETSARPTFGLRGKCLLRNSPYLLRTMQDIILHVRFDEWERIKELLLQTSTSLQNRLGRHAMGYAICEALSELSQGGLIQEQMQGISYYRFIQNCSREIDKNPKPFFSALEGYKTKVIHENNPELVISTEKADYQWLKEQDFYGLHRMHGKKFNAWENLKAGTKMPRHIGRQIPSGVAFNCLGFKTIRSVHHQAPLLAISTELMEHKILHPKIREQGGAYGSGASYIGSQGIFYFYSYRDSLICNTIKAFHEAMETIANGRFSESELEEAKLSLLQNIDTPVNPAYQGITAYSWQRDGKTYEFREQYRQRIFLATREEICQTAGTYLLGNAQEGRFVTYAGKDVFDREIPKLKETNIHLEILPID